MSKNPRGRGAQSDYVQTSRRRQPFSSNYSGDRSYESDYRNQGEYSRNENEGGRRDYDDRYSQQYGERDFYNDESRSSVGYGDQYENAGSRSYSERDYYGRNPSDYRNYNDENEFTPYRSSRDRGQGTNYGNQGFGSLRQSFDDRYRGQSNPYREFDTENYRRSDRGRFSERGLWEHGDNWEEGQFRGKGPKGYSRSDDRIKEDVSDTLTDNSMIDASDIEISVSNGEVTLSGTVNSKRNKRLAEDLAESVSGVRNIENKLRVKQSNESQEEYSAKSSLSGEQSKKRQTSQTLN